MKFKTADGRYLAERKRVSAKYGPRELWSVADAWPLYCGVSNLARTLAIADVVRASLKVPGHIAEFGSWRGANLLYMAKLLRIMDPHGGKIVHGFDSFRGLTEFRAQDAEARRKFSGHYKGSLEELRDVIGLYEMQDDVVLHRGLIEKTLPQALKKDKSLTFSMVYCDTDLYSSTKLILKLLHPRLALGGVFVFDEWNDEDMPGEGIAANEFLHATKGCYEAEHLPGTRHPNLLIRKIRL